MWNDAYQGGATCSRWALARFVSYMLAVAVVLEAIVLVQRRMPGSDQLFQEGYALEWIQFGLLVTTSVVLFAASIRFPSSRELYRIMAILPVMAGVRELDHKFDRWFGKGGWGITCIILGALCIFLAVRGRKVLKGQFRRLVENRSFGYLASAVVLVLAISRIIGQKVFWKGYLGEEKYTRDVPRAVEELGELSGYLMLTCGVLELYFTTRRAVSSSPPRRERKEEEEKMLVGAGAE